MLLSFIYRKKVIWFWTHLLEIEIDDKGTYRGGFSYKLSKKQQVNFYNRFPNIKISLDHNVYFEYKEKELTEFVFFIIQETSLLKDFLAVEDL